MTATVKESSAEAIALSGIPAENGVEQNSSQQCEGEEAMRILKVTTLAAASLCVVGLGVARAANVNFIETGDVVTVEHDANFECGFQSTVDGENAHVEACWITNSPNGYSGIADAYLVEPGGLPGVPRRVSDKLHILFGVGPNPSGLSVAHMSIDFVSDPETAPPESPPPGVPVLEENGQPQLVIGYFVNAFGDRTPPPANITIYVQSDLDPTVGVERSSWQNVKALYR